MRGSPNWKREMPEVDSTVWVTQQNMRMEDGVLVPVVDLTPATNFGTVKFIMPSSVKPWDFESAQKIAVQSAVDFNPVDDYMILLGPPSRIAMVFAIFLDRAAFMEAHYVNVLHWGGRGEKGKYSVIRCGVDLLCAIDWDAIE